MDDGERFFSRFWPEARAIADRDGFFYAAFGLGRGRLKQLFGPVVFMSAIRAMRAGHSIGRPTGDIFRMPGIYIVKGADIVRSMPLADAGEHVDVEALLKGHGSAE